ncbi:hypothetical protein J7T55_001116 [Diaporthe amygdali]|uniref:uncharacterized protein n=1 Tax=Phomopsis amygdali TaxID=1214568 RepID=UPI0022FDF20D|nr:uncharacterized protein J7T55_001116 [Diaporthe amygdali]KAJ0120259.1 hypothetical protein J7T55_001116 [Diaporthe amygdali]
MSFFSFLASLLPTRFVATESQNEDHAEMQAKNQTDEHAAVAKWRDRFTLFPRLPPELRHMVIMQALKEEEYARVVILDPGTDRISPTVELAARRSPLLFVNSELRGMALTVYTKLDVFSLGAPKDDQYGPEHDWYISPISEFDYLGYYVDIRRQIDQEAKDYGVHKGSLYINPKKDMFITGVIPRTAVQSLYFRSITDDESGPWEPTRDCVTEPLPPSVCGKITKMRDLEWDLEYTDVWRHTCDFCGSSHLPCCTEDFFNERGEDWVPDYPRDVYTSVESYGFYLLAYGDDVQEFLWDLIIMGGKKCLEEWERRYLEFDLSMLQEEN